MPLSYRIGALGWYNFEDLTQTLLKIIIGPGVSSFGGSKDGGRDATFYGSANFPSKTAKWRGYWVFQAKYYDYEILGAPSCRQRFIRDLPREFPKILSKNRRRNLVKRKPKPYYRRLNPNNYIIITNLPITAKNRDDISILVTNSGYTGNFLVIDGKDLCQLLDIYPLVRRRYPQLLGLADLSYLLNQEIYTRSESFLRVWQPRLSTFVRTQGFDAAETVIKNRYFVVIDGPPEVGKSTIAAALALTFATGGFQIVDLRDPGDFNKILSQERPQLFVADDAIGSVSFDPSQNDKWCRELHNILIRLDKNHLLVWTTRKYILERALLSSKLGELGTSFPVAHEVVVTAGDVSDEENAAILYNHCKEADLSEKAREVIRSNGRSIVSHPNFTPLRANQIAKTVLEPLKGGDISLETVLDFLADPGAVWERAYNALSEGERQLLMCLIEYDWEADVKDLRKNFEDRMAGFSEPTSYDFTQIISALDNSFIKCEQDYLGENTVDFQHPSVRDLIIRILSKNKGIRTRFIALSSARGIATLVRGVGGHSQPSEDDEHSIRVTDPDDFNSLHQRLSELINDGLTLEEWEEWLAACSLLLPRIDEGSRGPILPGELNIEEFNGTEPARILTEVLRGFCAYETYDNNRSATIDDWVEPIKKAFELAEYQLTAIRPAYVRELFDLCNLDDVETALPLLAVVGMWEPVVAVQYLNLGVLDKWRRSIAEKIGEAIALGEEMESAQDDSLEYYEEYHDVYTEWAGESRKLIELARAFSLLARSELGKGIDELETVLYNVESPEEPWDDDDEGYGRGAAAEYWTVDRILEDL